MIMTWTVVTRVVIQATTTSSLDWSTRCLTGTIRQLTSLKARRSLASPVKSTGIPDEAAKNSLLCLASLRSRTVDNHHWNSLLRQDYWNRCGRKKTTFQVHSLEDRLPFLSLYFTFGRFAWLYLVSLRLRNAFRGRWPLLAPYLLYLLTLRLRTY